MTFELWMGEPPFEISDVYCRCSVSLPYSRSGIGPKKKGKNSCQLDKMKKKQLNKVCERAETKRTGLYSYTTGHRQSSGDPGLATTPKAVYQKHRGSANLIHRSSTSEPAESSLRRNGDANVHYMIRCCRNPSELSNLPLPSTYIKTILRTDC